MVLPQPTPPYMYSPLMDGRLPPGPAVPCRPDCDLSNVLKPSNLHNMQPQQQESLSASNALTVNKGAHRTCVGHRCDLCRRALPVATNAWHHGLSVTSLPVLASNVLIAGEVL
jgi:hypothetical protein